MSLHTAAKYLASRGRDGDTELVHMTKGEVKSLQGLALAAGGSLSINPNTGLVEASFLKRILPMVAGAGLMMIPGVGPLAAAGMVGGFETLRTGDLGRGLMAGLGAYGGAGLAQGLSTAGAQTLGTTGTQATPIATENVGANALRESAGLGGTTSIPTSNVAAETLRSTAPAPVTMQNMGAGIKSLGTTGGPSAVYGALPGGTLPSTGIAVADAMTPAPSVPGMPEEDPRYKRGPYAMSLSPNYRPVSPLSTPNYYRPVGLGYAGGGSVYQGPQTDFFPQSQVSPTQYATPTQMPGSREVINADFDAAVNPYDGNPMMFAEGGSLSMKSMSIGDGIYRDTDDDTASLGAYEAAKKRLEKIGRASNVKMSPMPKTNVSRLGEVKMASGGLGAYSDGGRMLKGPGDGMSDDIPAVIGSKQPARLADGEFVVPADVVSHLGNGSTDAGARKLYKMMDKVRVARTGKKKQAPAVKTDKFIPRG